MVLGVEIIVSILAHIIGYVVTCRYFFDKEKMNLKQFMPISRNRIIYLLVGICGFSILLYMFSTAYADATLVHQMKLLVLVGFLFPIAAIDFKVKKIPNKILLAALILRLLLLLIEFAVSVSDAIVTLKSSVIAVVILFVFFLLILLLFKNSIGMGDVKLFVVIGLYQGIWGSVNSVFYSLVAAFFLSIALLISKKKTRKDTISFGPCILLGVIFAIASTGI